MQVVVNLPRSHESIQSISFELPAAGQSIRVPCRLVRAERNGSADEQTLGIEFLHEAETQLFLIERFIQDTASRDAESRQLPRTSCRLTNVQVDRPGIRVLSVDNLSTDGLLFSFTGTLRPLDAVTLTLLPPDDPRPMALRGEVVYVLENAFREAWSAGVRLGGLREIEESRLRNLILAVSSGITLRGVYDHLDGGAEDGSYRITEAARIASLLAGLRERAMPLTILLEDDLTIRERSVVEVREAEGVFAVRCPERESGLAALQGRSAYSGFPWNGSSYYFKTRIAAAEDDRLLLEFPQSIYHSDKRSYGRKSPDVGSRIRLLVEPVGGAEREIEGTLIDVSRRGFLCEVDAAPGLSLQGGDQVRYSLDARLELDSYGQVRHVQTISAPSGTLLRIGIEAGIARRAVEHRRVGAEEWSRSRPFREGSIPPPEAPLESTVVRYRSRDGKEMCALLNETGLAGRAPVVVVPPSYGKKKESYAPLVATLLANFRRLGKPLVTLRYDGINRPGESHTDLPNARRGYEMLSYRISQGLRDLEATMDFVRSNPYFQADGVILVTFSMAALDARRYLATHRDEPGEGGGGSVRFWISCMGVPSAQTTLRNILGGIDIIANQRLGVPNGIIGLLGHLVNTDILAHDMLDARYAFVTDARLDMARIRQPVLWIGGLHDRWVDSEEVSDLMSVGTEGRREVLEIPCGHNLRTSDDAIQTFRIIAAELYRELHGERIEPCDPCRPQMLSLLSAERERLLDRAPPPLTEYWRGYLVGNERNRVGYDFYANLAEFRAFLRDQCELLRLGERETIADLGCGTGLLLEVLLEFLASHPGRRQRHRIVALDLVPEALERARQKCDRILLSSPSLAEVRLSYHRADLEPSRIEPLERFIRSPEAGLSCLQGKVAGLPHATLERLIERSTPALDALARGAWPAPELLEAVRGTIEGGDWKALLELNRAVRFILGRVADGDLRDAAARDLGRPLRTSDLLFELLELGDSEPSPPSAIPRERYTRIVASLFISYLFNPEYLLEECRELLEPGGMILVSSMKPDSDISTIFTNYIRNLEGQDAAACGDAGVTGALAMLNEAAGLFELEEDGYFRFYTDRELEAMLLGAGFVDVHARSALGDPCQASIATGRKAASREA